METSSSAPAPDDFPPSPPAPSVRPRSLGRKIFLALIVIVLLAVFAGGLFAYTVLFEAPRQAVTESLTALAAARSFRQEVKIKVVSGGSLAMPVAETTIVIDFEQPPAASPRTAAVINVNASGFFVGAEIRLLDQTAYGRITEFPGLSLLFSSFGLSASTSPVGQWYSVALAEIEKYAAEHGVDPEILAKFRERFDKIGQAEGQPRFDFGGLVEEGVLVFGKRASLTQVDGVWARQYAITVNREKLSSILADLIKKEAGIVDSFSKMFTFDPVVVTIGLFDHSLKKITGGVKFSSDGQSAVGPAGAGTLSFSIAYRDVNGPVSVVKPPFATSLIQYIEQSVETSSSTLLRSRILP